ncbi:hypothetical protein F4814DRAFT_402956 [Daldinia grandis]|nr:hypothetical protein F4814DRAFT_402956 [Daldinia grandis]
MPLLYDEGSKEFIRLLREIIKVPADQIILAWDLYKLGLQARASALVQLSEVTKSNILPFRSQIWVFPCIFLSLRLL